MIDLNSAAKACAEELLDHWRMADRLIQEVDKPYHAVILRHFTAWSEQWEKRTLTQHAGDCTIYSALMSGSPCDGICTCGYGWTLVTEGDWSQMYSAERAESMKWNQRDQLRAQLEAMDEGRQYLQVKVETLERERDQLAGQLQKKDGYFAWLVENGRQHGQGLRYVRMGYAGMFGWTEDPHAALHFCRRADAEEVSAECEDAWLIVEHWFELKAP